LMRKGGQPFYSRRCQKSNWKNRGNTWDILLVFFHLMNRTVLFDLILHSPSVHDQGNFPQPPCPALHCPALQSVNIFSYPIRSTVLSILYHPTLCFPFPCHLRSRLSQACGRASFGVHRQITGLHSQPVTAPGRRH